MEQQLQLATFYQAIKLKQLGFDWKCRRYFKSDGRSEESQIEENFNDTKSLKEMYRDIISAPTVTLAFKWFRDEYGLKHDIDDDNIGTKFYYKIKSYTKKFDNYDILTLIRREREWDKIEFKTYEEAELACLEKLIEVIKSKAK